jgi:uncharacterized protein YecT (DUF1311 family)
MQHPKSLFAAGTLCLLTGLLASHCAEAADSGCQDAATTAAMRACENTRYEKSERELNAAYATLTKQLDPTQQEKLRGAQRAWLAFRDANAQFLAGVAQAGTLAPLIKVTALADMTEARTKELEKLQRH